VIMLMLKDRKLVQKMNYNMVGARFILLLENLKVLGQKSTSLFAM